MALQVARAGRFGTKGLAITFVSDEKDAKVLNDVQDRFEVNVGELPETLDMSSYSKYKLCRGCCCSCFCLWGGGSWLQSLQDLGFTL